MKYPLSSIIFEVTPRCNLHCRYCYNLWKVPGQQVPQNDSYTKSLKTLKQLFRTAEVNHITFTGGEPLLAERIEELILFVRLKKKTVSIITNGSGGDAERYRTLTSMGIGLFEIPVHAHVPEIHDQITRVPGSWERSVKSIQQLKAMGTHVVPVIVATKMNLPVLRETLQFIHQLGFRQIMLNRYNIGGEGLSENERILPVAEDLRKGWSIANELAKKLKLQLSSNVCTPYCLLHPGDYPHIAFGHCSPRPTEMPLTLDPEGNLRLCNHSPVVAGNIFEQSFEEIFDSEPSTNWLKQIPAFCASCDWYARCLGGCRAASLQAGFSENDADPVVSLIKH